MSFRFGLGINMMFCFSLILIFLASPGISVICFWNLFRTMFFLASLFACLFSSFEIIIAFFFACFSFLAMTIGYGAMPANMTRILEFFFVSLVTSSAITFRSFDNLGEK